MNNCVFCQIVSHEIDHARIWEDDQFVAFLDQKPLNPGHLLVVPKKHEPSVFALPPELYAGLFKCAKTFEPTLRRVTRAKKIGMVIEGFGVNHAHLHIVPLHGGHQLDPNRAKEATETELEEMRLNILREMERSVG